MLDIKFIRENKDIVKMGAVKKHIDVDIDKLLELDEKRLEVLSRVEILRSEQNKVSQTLGQKIEDANRFQLIEEMRIVKEELKEKEDSLREITTAWQQLMVQVPNVPDISVPDGAGDEDNVEIKVVGEKKVFDFAPTDHITLMEKLDMADFERGTKVSGFRGYFLKNDGALLEFALWQFFLEKLIAKGFSPMIVPSLVNRQTLFGTGYLPQGEDDLYKTQDGDYLAGTGEVATMAYYSDEVIDRSKLPLKMLAFSPCFRREAGSHGKDVKGLIRVHEFFKFEQVVLCEANHTESVKYHEEITANVEEILAELELPYHIVLNCGGDIGLGQVKKYDIEVWMPSQQIYRETHSASYFHDFQTRRLNIRYKDENGKMQYAHSLNNTLVATPRILACIVENYQNADGTITVPKVLQKYINKELMS